ncbi:MAG: 5'/3'-nucleotidase SurE [Sedimentisphaerales bacterium]|nr:5'/3'-nucleotidase SurE [Sedimentisphaerales bacterium]
MQILLTNDDGIFAPGLAAIYKQLVKLGDVTVVAPASSRSGASHSLTFHHPVICNKVDINGLFAGYSVEGSPADCVKLAVLELCKDKPIDLLVSGINNGANAGIDVYYSGTVAAAMEGVFLKIPSVAMSLANEEEMNFEPASEYCYDILEKLLPLKNGSVININIPHLSMGKPKGTRVVPLSQEGYDDHYKKTINEQGQTVYQLCGNVLQDEKIHTDVTSLIQGYITITALSSKMMDYDRTEQLKEIL